MSSEYGQSLAIGMKYEICGRPVKDKLLKFSSSISFLLLLLFARVDRSLFFYPLWMLNGRPKSCLSRQVVVNVLTFSFVSV